MPTENSLQLPKHVAIIMDGNGRWAQKRGLSRFEGHRQGAETVELITEAARELGIGHLTLYAFSKENWKRPTDEVQALMRLLTEFLYSKKQKMQDNGIRLQAIGDLSKLAPDVLQQLNSTIHETSNGAQMVLTLCLSYGSRDEIVRAFARWQADQAKGGAASITEESLESYLDTHNMPDPDLVIRTSGEKRISNFLLWQSAYAEYIFTEACWPEFTVQDFKDCLTEYQNRERRFGLTREQI